MEVVVERTELVRTLGQLSKIPPGRLVAPILSHVLVRAESAGTLTLQCTDMDRSLRLFLPAEVVDGGEVAVPLGHLTSFARPLPGGSQVRLRMDGASMRAEGAGSRATLPTLPAADFPDLLAQPPEQGQVQDIDLPIDLHRLRAVLPWLLPLISTDSSTDARYHLTGIHLSSRPGGVVAEATNSKVLGREFLACDPGDALDEVGAIIPGPTARFLAELDDVEGLTLTLRRSGKNPVAILLRGGAIAFHSRLIDGTYPDLDRIIPGEIADATQIEIDCASLLSAVDAVAAFASNRDKIVNLGWLGDRLVLGTNSPDGAVALRAIQAAGRGEIGAAVLAGNIKAVARDGLMRIQFNDARSAIRISYTNHPNATGVLMPYVSPWINAIPDEARALAVGQEAA